MTVLTDEMRAVIRNEHCVYQTEDELYAALIAVTPKQSTGNPVVEENQPVAEIRTNTGFGAICAPFNEVWFYNGIMPPVGTKFYTAPVSRNAVIEECAAICDRFQARDVGMQPAECAGAIRALKSQPAKPDPRDEALRIARAARDALSLFLDSHEECTDFDGFTAQTVSMDDYHSAQESLEAIDAAIAGEKK